MAKTISIEKAKQVAMDAAIVAAAAMIDPGRYVGREDGEELGDWMSRARFIAVNEFLSRTFPPPKPRTEEQIMRSYRTSCCTAKSKGVGRAHWVCEKCGKDVSMEVVLFFDCMAKEEEKT
jgi:hypothetical protein